MVSNASQLMTGNVGGALQLWSVDHTHSPLAVSMNKSMELDRGIFSAVFDSKMELVINNLNIMYHKNITVYCITLFPLQGVIGTSSGSVWYVNWSDMSKVKLISGHTSEICDIAFARDGTHFASCGQDGLLSVWNVESLEQIVAFQASRKSCTCVAFAPVQIRASVGDNEREHGEVSPFNIPDLVAGYSDGTIRIFSVSDVKLVRKMQPHATTVRRVMYSFDGESHDIVQTGSFRDGQCDTVSVPVGAVKSMNTAAL